MTDQIEIVDVRLGTLTAIEVAGRPGVWNVIYQSPLGAYWADIQGIEYAKEVAYFWELAWKQLLHKAKAKNIICFTCAPTSPSRERAYMRRGWVKYRDGLAYHVISQEATDAVYSAAAVADAAYDAIYQEVQAQLRTRPLYHKLIGGAIGAGILLAAFFLSVILEPSAPTLSPSLQEIEDMRD